MNRVLGGLGYENMDARAITDVQLACDVWCVAVEGCVRSGDPKPDDAKVGEKYYQELQLRRKYAMDVYNAMVKVTLAPDDSGCYVPENGSNNKVPYIPQSGSKPWATTPFGNGDDRTISSSGCSIASLSMVLSYLSGEYIYPDEIMQKIRDANGGKNIYAAEVGASWDVFPGVASMYGFTGKAINSSEVDGYLKSGYPVIQSCNAGEFTGNKHFIVITGTDGNGGYYVNDPNSNYESYSLKVYKLENIIGSPGNGKGWWVIQ